jgi:hypothetical protein
MPVEPMPDEPLSVAPQNPPSTLLEEAESAVLTFKRVPKSLQPAQGAPQATRSNRSAGRGQRRLGLLLVSGILCLLVAGAMIWAVR